MWGDIAIAFLLAFITTFVVTPHTMRLAKKVGAIDIPNDRRVNKKPMPRLRRFGSNFRIYCFSNLSIYYNLIRRKTKSIWWRTILLKNDWILFRSSYIRNNLLYRWLKRSSKFSKIGSSNISSNFSCFMWNKNRKYFYSICRR